MKTRLAIASCLMLAACGTASKPTPAPLENTVESPAKPDPLAVEQTSNPVTIELLEAGAAPFQKLRLGFKPADEARSVIRMVMVIDIALDGVNLNASPSPPMAMAYRMQVTDASSERFRVEYTMTDVVVEEDPRVTAEQLERVRAALKGADRIGGWAVSDRRGVVIAEDTELPEDLSPELANMYSNTEAVGSLFIPLPAEPVGVGARWVVTATEEANFPVKTTTLYTLVSSSGGQVTLEYMVEQEGIPGPVDLKQLPAGTSASLLAHQGEGRGQITIGLDRLGSTGESMVEAKSRMSIEAEGTSHEMDMQMSFDVRIR